MMKLTIDASVVGDSMFEGPLTPQADALFVASIEFVAPANIEAELLSIATKRVRTGRSELLHAQKRWRFALALPVRYIPITRFGEVAFELSARLEHPSYDCLYLAAAMSEEAPLVTADRRLLERAVAAGLGGHVRWLGDAARAT